MKGQFFKSIKHLVMLPLTVIVALIIGAILYLHYLASSGINEIMMHQIETNSNRVLSNMANNSQKLMNTAKFISNDHEKIRQAIEREDKATIEAEIEKAATAANCSNYIFTDINGRIIASNVVIADYPEFNKTIMAAQANGETSGFTNFAEQKVTQYAATVISAPDGTQIGIAMLLDKSINTPEVLSKMRKQTGLEYYVYINNKCTSTSASEDVKRCVLDDAIADSTGRHKQNWIGKSDYLGERNYMGATPLLTADGNSLAILVFSTDTSTANRVMGIINLFIPCCLIVLLVLYTVISTAIFFGVSKPIERLVENFKVIATGDLTQSMNMKEGTCLELQAIADSVDEMEVRIRSVLQPVKATIGDINSMARTLAESSNTLSEAANKQAAGIEQISSSMEEMTSVIQQNTSNSIATREKAEQINKMAHTLSKSSTDSYEAIVNISNNVTDIDTLVMQTNILALNASVEAARAGEQGKGFGVVAKEVRRLADQTHDTAAAINDTATSSIAGAEEAYKQVTELTPMIQDIATLVNEITEASIEQNSGVGQVNIALSELNHATQENAANAEEIASSSENMRGMTEDLKDALKVFKLS